MKFRSMLCGAVLLVGTLVATGSSAEAASTHTSLDGLAFVRNTNAVAPGASECTTNADGSISYGFEDSGTVFDVATFTPVGTFTESVVVRILAPDAITPVGNLPGLPAISPPEPSTLIKAGAIVQLDAGFSATLSDGTTISGSKTLTSAATRATDYGTCRYVALSDGFGVQGRYKSVWSPSLAYTAIVISNGTSFVDHGSSLLRAREAYFTDSNGNLTFSNVSELAEPFTSTGSVLADGPGKATGGGQVGSLTFGFNAKRSATESDGICSMLDRSTRVDIRCVTVDSYNQSGALAVFSGQASVDGASTAYSAYVVDGGEPGAGQDTIYLCAGGSCHGGVLTSGNVEVHA